MNSLSDDVVILLQSELEKASGASPVQNRAVGRFGGEVALDLIQIHALIRGWAPGVSIGRTRESLAQIGQMRFGESGLVMATRPDKVPRCFTLHKSTSVSRTAIEGLALVAVTTKIFANGRRASNLTDPKGTASSAAGNAV